MKKYSILTLFLSIALGVLSALCIAATALLCTAGISSEIYTEKKTSSVHVSELEETYDYGEGYIKSIVWVSDRTLSYLGSLQSISPSQHWSGEDDNLRLDLNLANSPIVSSNGKKYSSASNASEQTKPKYMIITVGLDNGVGYCTEEKFKEYYSRLIESVKEASPDTRIMLQSILPVSRSVEKDSPSISNDRIRQVNIWICDLSRELSLRYLDTHSALTDEHGYLNEKFDSGDGVALNEAGCLAMLDYVRTHGYK